MRRKVNKLNKDLFRRNINKILLGIPKLSAGRGLNGKFINTHKLSNFTRYEIHNFYIIY